MGRLPGGNNSTRVLRFPLSRCQYLRPKEYTGTKASSNRVPILPCEAHLLRGSILATCGASAGASRSTQISFHDLHHTFGSLLIQDWRPRQCTPEANGALEHPNHNRCLWPPDPRRECNLDRHSRQSFSKVMATDAHKPHAQQGSERTDFRCCGKYRRLKRLFGCPPGIRTPIC